MTAQGTKYDDATWHSGGQFPADLPDEAGGTHIAMFVAWALVSGLGGKLHLVESKDGVKGLRDRSLTPGQFLFKYCDGQFGTDDLNDEGNAFALAYYQRKTRGYVFEYERWVARKLPTVYHVPDSWKTYDKLSPLLDGRFNEWRAQTLRKPWWRFW